MSCIHLSPRTDAAARDLADARSIAIGPPWGRRCQHQQLASFGGVVGPARATGRRSAPFLPSRQPDESWWSSRRATCRWLAGGFLESARPIGVDLHAGAAQADPLRADADQAMRLEGLEHAVQHARRRPTAQPRVDRGPVAEPLRPTRAMGSRSPPRRAPHRSGRDWRSVRFPAARAATGGSLHPVCAQPHHAMSLPADALMK